MFFVFMAAIIVGCKKTTPQDTSVESESSQIDKPSSQNLPPNDQQALKRLVARINKNGDINDPAVPNPLVTLEEFFEGNNDYGSIGYNFTASPSPAEFYSFFKQIRSRPGVANVLVQVCQHEEPEGWPSTDTVWIITRAGADEVKRWLGKRFEADDILVGWSKEKDLVEFYKVPEGMQAIGVWWD
jgi:hypothetical protein